MTSAGFAGLDVTPADATLLTGAVPVVAAESETGAGAADYSPVVIRHKSFQRSCYLPKLRLTGWSWWGMISSCISIKQPACRALSTAAKVGITA